MDEWQQVTAPVSVFYSYAPEDEKLRQRLEKHLSLLRRQGLISDWHHHQISAGSDRQQSIDSHLEGASVILLLISPDFMASDYCYGVEMQRALERHRVGLAHVIPVLLRSVDWRGAPFAFLQSLPRNGRPVTRWSDSDAAFAAIVDEISKVVATLRDAEEASPISKPVLGRQAVRDQNCVRFIKRVRAMWIVGLLERSLYNATLLTLGLQELPHAVVNPWHLLVQEMDQPVRPLPPTTHINEVYDDAEGALLILGEPGSGKTTLLLELARDLLERAESTADHPLPAIFNLSSWAEKCLPLASWLVEELHTRYQVPRKLGAAWIESDQLLPLLDGLDEVAATQRMACVAAINQYRQDHSSVPLVVCSRHSEYMAQPARIMLRQSVMIQPLTVQQIDETLSSAGEQLAALRTALHEDMELQELATTPLLLNILMLTYQDEALDDLAAIKSPMLQREQLFARYVARMLQRRGVERRYTQQQTIIWLVSLARQMKRHGQTEFYIERLQMNWLVRANLRRYYRIGTTLVCALIGMLIGLLVIWLTVKPEPGILGILISGLGFAVAVGLISGLQPEIRPSEVFIWSRKIVFHRWYNMPLLMLFCGLVGGLGVNPGDNPLVSVLISGLFGILSGIAFNILMDGVPAVMPDTQHISTPNQEIRRSAHHSLLVIGISALFILLFIPLNKLEVILVCGFGLAGAISFGGLACIQHITLRWLLWRSGEMPWRLPKFLDYAAERILLRKVGGGYIFIHRLLLEYFASLEEIS